MANAILFSRVGVDCPRMIHPFFVNSPHHWGTHSLEYPMTEITIKVGNQIKRITISADGTQFLWAPLTADEIAAALVQHNTDEVLRVLRTKLGDVIDQWVSSNVTIAQ